MGVRRRGRASRVTEATIESLLASKEIAIVCGTGGVGKTTTSAAMAAMAAHELGGRVLVLTVDPARRLAQAMGLAELTDTEVRVELPDHDGRRPRGELYAAMLDTSGAWNDLVTRYAPDAAAAQAVLANPLYRNITSRFVRSHDYIAMERLHELHSSGRYDLVIIDTPPSRNALDVLDAPARMREFFGSRLLRWLTVPARNRLLSVASKPFYQVADRVLGSSFMQDIADFFVLLQSMEKGFVERAGEVERLLHDQRCTFVVVSTLEAASLSESQFFTAALRERGLHLGAFIANRVLPAELRATNAAKASIQLRRRAWQLGDLLEPVVDAPAERIAGVLAEVADRFDDLAVVAKRESERLIETEGLAPAVATVPLLGEDIHDLSGLLMLGTHLWR